MVLDGDRPERGEGGREGQHPLGQVGMQADPLELGRGERASLVPDRVRDAEPPEVVDEPGPANRDHLGRLGVDGNQLSVLPRGALDAKGTDEPSWAQDRRVDFAWK